MHIGFILLLSVFSSRVFATTLSVVTEEFPLFQYYKNGELVGSSVEKVTDVLKRANIDYQIGVNRWSVSYIAATRDPNTCIFSMGRSSTREHLFTWVFPIAHFTTSFYGLKSENIQVNVLGDAKKYKTGVIRNNYSHQYLQARGFSEDQHLVMLSNFDRVFELLQTRKGLLDLVILSDTQFDYRAQTDPFTKQLEKVFTLKNQGAQLYFACNKQVDKDIIEKISNAYKALLNESSLFNGRPNKTVKSI
ncbi:polar amino acid transport system substrate-binding protein [Pseudoalteromonas citrea]|uniref:Polar amino acid transport system substrate-binding protein n=2 Tax=Pseudoalteromonas citrea TaxID=43655 RepID=A0AAD4AEP6_9GAMM|nr:transporter substrate-binding domain-containing protein [Pseudoalteromonas citrea]KAF7764512.1 polar amino acid transport system substrate-binding protein [Pseudoalteromonas citrea]